MEIFEKGIKKHPRTREILSRNVPKTILEACRPKTQNAEMKLRVLEAPGAAGVSFTVSRFIFGGASRAGRAPFSEAPAPPGIDEKWIRKGVVERYGFVDEKVWFLDGFLEAGNPEIR